MCPIPVFFIRQCPGNPDADSVILTGFWKIIADDDKEQSHKQFRNKSHVKLISQIVGINYSGYEYRGNRNDPQYKGKYLGADVLLPWIVRCDNRAYPFHDKEKKGNTNDSEGFTAETVGFI